MAGVNGHGADMVQVGQILSKTRNDVVNVHNEVTRVAKEIGGAVRSCTPPLDAPTIAAWRSMTERCVNYLKDEPTIFRATAQVEAGQQILKDLQPWYDTLRDHGCIVTLSVRPAPIPTSGLSFGGLEKLDLGDMKTILLLVVAWNLVSAFKKGR